MESFFLSVLAEDHVFYRGPCVSLTVPLGDGLYGILARHSNVVSAVVPGELSFTTDEGKTIVAAVSNGIIKVENNDVLLLVESAELPENIDDTRAQRMAAEAKEALLSKQSLMEYRMSQAVLIRATNRLRVKHKHTK